MDSGGSKMEDPSLRMMMSVKLKFVEAKHSPVPPPDQRHRPCYPSRPGLAALG